MCGTVAGHQPRTVHSEQHIQLHQIDIMDDLVVGALEKCGIDGDYGQQPLAGQTRRKRDGVFLRHADVKERPGWRCLKKFRPVPYFMAAVMPHSRGSSSPKSASAQPNVDEKESFGDSSGSVRWFKSMDDTAWNSPGFSSAGFRPLPFW